MKSHIISNVLAWAVGIAVVWAALYIIAAVFNHANAEEPIQDPWQPPEIPRCDQPLWNRVKDKCNETSN